MVGQLLDIHFVPARLEISQKPCWENLGIKSTEKYIDEFSEKSKETALTGDARRVREGNRVMRLDKGEKNVLQHISKEKMMQPTIVSTRTYSPDVRAVMTYIPGQLDIEYLGNNFDQKG